MIDMHSDYSIYDALYDEARRKGWPGWGGKARIAKGPDQVARILENPYVPRSGKVIELGCGEGHLCRLLAVHGYSVTGIDVSARAIEWALEKEGHEKNITYVQGNLCHSDVLVDESFDLVVDGNCLHCILGKDRPLFLRNAQRLLADGGVFFVSSLCSKDDLSVTLMRAGQPYRHVAGISSLLLELENAQFQVLEWVVYEREEVNHINVFAGKCGVSLIDRTTIGAGVTEPFCWCRPSPDTPNTR